MRRLRELLSRSVNAQRSVVVAVGLTPVSTRRKYNGLTKLFNLKGAQQLQHAAENRLLRHKPNADQDCAKPNKGQSAEYALKLGEFENEYSYYGCYDKEARRQAHSARSAP